MSGANRHLCEQSPYQCRRGLAYDELLVILVALCMALCVVFAMIPESAPDDPGTSLPREAAILPELVTQLDEHLVSTVRVTRFRPPPENSPIVFTSRILIAHRERETSEMSLLEIVITDCADTHAWGIARVWTLVDSQLAMQLSDPDASRRSKIGIKSIPGLLDGKHPNFMLPIQRCDESIQQLAPPELRNSGILVDISECDLTEMESLPRFPLRETTAAIRAYTQSHPEPTRNLPALLNSFDTPTGPITSDDVQALSDALLYRLLDFLPEE